MQLRGRHIALIAFLVCLVNCRADDPRIVVSDLEHTSTRVSPSSDSSSLLISKLTTLSSAAKIESTSDPLIEPNYKEKTSTSTTVSHLTSKPASENVSLTISVVGDVTIPTIPSPTTVSSDPDPDPVTVTTSQPPTTPSQPTVPSTNATEPSTSSSSTATSTISSSSSSTVTTAAPMTTSVPDPHHHSRQFDGPSFMGGIVLASGLMAISFVAFKFYKARTERNYHTL